MMMVFSYCYLAVGFIFVDSVLLKGIFDSFFIFWITDGCCTRLYNKWKTIVRFMRIEMGRGLKNFHLLDGKMSLFKEETNMRSTENKTSQDKKCSNSNCCRLFLTGFWILKRRRFTMLTMVDADSSRKYRFTRATSIYYTRKFHYGFAHANYIYRQFHPNYYDQIKRYSPPHIQLDLENMQRLS